MVKCENCIHKEVCNGALLYPKAELNCSHYKDKSLFVELPCKDNMQKAISEKWKRTSRQIAELKKEILKNDEILELKKDISYKDYQDLLQTNALKKEELKKLQIEINIWDIAREIVLNGGKQNESTRIF